MLTDLLNNFFSWLNLNNFLILFCTYLIISYFLYSRKLKIFTQIQWFWVITFVLSWSTHHLRCVTQKSISLSDSQSQRTITDILHARPICPWILKCYEESDLKVLFNSDLLFRSTTVSPRTLSVCILYHTYLNLHCSYKAFNLHLYLCAWLILQLVEPGTVES